jgi:hypothetical protein
MLARRPNPNDWITGSTLQFDDGSVVPVGPLINNGAGVVVNFSPKTTASICFTITSVSSTTSNPGLAELVVYGSLVVPNVTVSLPVNSTSYANSTLTNTTSSVTNTTSGLTNSTTGSNSTLANLTS